MIEAAKALVDIPGDRTRQELEDVLETAAAPEGRRMAAWALGFLGKTDAAPALIRALSDPDEEESVRCYAAEALGHLLDSAPRNPAAIAALERALADPSPAIRLWALFGLGNFGDPSDIPTLERHVDDTADVPGWRTVGEEAAWALDQIRSRAHHRG